MSGVCKTKGKGTNYKHCALLDKVLSKGNRG